MQETKAESLNNLVLKTSLFKGRTNLYYSYLKTEKLALALSEIFGGTEFSDTVVLKNLLDAAGQIPGLVAQYAARELSEGLLVARFLQVVTHIRLAVAQKVLNPQNGVILCSEYEQLLDRITVSSEPSFFVAEDFSVSSTLPAKADFGNVLTYEDGQKGEQPNKSHKGRSTRTDTILNFVLENKRVSIKDISKNIKDYSEKTIQRELGVLMHMGLVRKEGERRWSVYLPAEQGAGT